MSGLWPGQAETVDCLRCGKAMSNPPARCPECDADWFAKWTPTPEEKLKVALVQAFSLWLGDGAEHMQRQIWRLGQFTQFMDEAARIFDEHGFGTEDE